MDSNNIIIPAILPKSFTDLKQHLVQMQGVAPLVQVDVVDGIFAPTKTWPYTGGDEFEKIVAQDEGLPFWEDIDFQFDLMLANPKDEMERFVQTGAASVIVHAMSPGAKEALVLLQESRPIVSVGVAFLPSAAVADVQAFEGLYDFVQVMGIAEVGSQGKPFDTQTLFLVAALRAARPELLIQIDGGVSLSNAEALVQAGANRLVVGSAIFGAKDPVDAYKALYTRVNAL